MWQVDGKKSRDQKSLREVEKGIEEKETNNFVVHHWNQYATINHSVCWNLKIRLAMVAIIIDLCCSQDCIWSTITQDLNSSNINDKDRKLLLDLI